MRWREILDRAVEERRTVLCIGLDTDMTRFADEGIIGRSQFEINREIIEYTHEYAAAYKLNQAFYEAEGPEGSYCLKKTVDLIKKHYPEILVILDSKKGDIGNTSKAYARAAYDHLGVDSVTLNPYMGRDAVDPFSMDRDRLGFVLCRTSNKAASSVQDHGGDPPLFLKMAELIKTWNERGNLGLVVGATYPDEMEKIRERIGFEMPILVPGVGAQGGDLRKVLDKGSDQQGGNVLINVSRGIMFEFSRHKDGSERLGEYAAGAAEDYRGRIREEMKRCGRW
jgi:orotidine-5'-phosphate decarboxylase